MEEEMIVDEQVKRHEGRLRGKVERRAEGAARDMAARWCEYGYTRSLLKDPFVLCCENQMFEEKRRGRQERREHAKCWELV